MRQAILLEATELRAQVDPEYLDVMPPGLATRDGGPHARDDLPLLQDPGFEELLDRRHRRAHADALRFHQFLVRGGWDGRDRSQAAEILAAGPCRHPPGEILRACFIAYALNWRGGKVGLDAETILREFFGRLRRRVPRDPRPLARLGDTLARAAARLTPQGRHARSLYRAINEYVPEEDLRPRLFLPFLRAGPMIHAAARTATLAERERAARRSHARDTLRRVALRPGFWSEQLVTVRTLQSLAVLDVMRYFRLVWELGEYDAGVASPPPER
jgi:hypothetical protein